MEQPCRITYFIKDIETADDAAVICEKAHDFNDGASLEWWAELAAEHAWGHNSEEELIDGFIVVILVNGQEYGRFGIHVDWSPVFHVSKILH